jgi:hypothetical protein
MYIAREATASARRIVFRASGHTVSDDAPDLLMASGTATARRRVTSRV